MLEQLDQGRHVVAPHHRSKQARGLQRRDQGTGGLPLGHGAEPGGFHIGRLVHPGGDAIHEQLSQGRLFPSRRVLQQLGERTGLFSRHGERRNTLGFAFSGKRAVGAQHAKG